jgi:hypothetical protein
MQKRSIALLASTGIAGLVTGGVLMTGLSANAADDPGSPSTGSSSTTGHGNGNTDPTKPMRDDEELLTGTTKEKVTAAVKAKYPDATFQRVESDSDGVYEAHILVDGKPVTVELDKSFAITGTEAAPTGGGDHDGDGPEAQTPAA